MTIQPRRVLVTGAAGFIGRAVTDALRSDTAHAADRLVLFDTARVEPFDMRTEIVQGDLADPAACNAAIGEGVDLVYHLAGIVGGAAEVDYAMARRINVDATLSLFELLRDTGRRPRVVYTSSIAVFGEPPPRHVDDTTVMSPTMTYGAQKRMMEIALAQFSARGWLDGLSVRLPAIVAKPPVAGMEAVFLNRIFHAFAAGAKISIPVSPRGTLWLLSTTACASALMHAGRIPGNEIGHDRALTLPAQRVTVRALIEALERRYPESTAQITFAPVPRIEAQFASQPPLTTSAADRLGFVHDGDLDQLVARATA